MSAATASLAGRLAALLPEAEVRRGYGQSSVAVPASTWKRAALAARDELGCTLFDWLGAADTGRPGDSGSQHTVFLHVMSVHPTEGLLLCTHIDRHAGLPSVAAVWPGAAWHERELAEMFGVELLDHPDPRHLLLPETFAGHPLRKDFVLASRLRPWPGRLEPGEGAARGVGRPANRRLVPPGVPDPSWGPRHTDRHGETT